MAVLVGRSREVAEIDSALKDAGRGRGALVLVAGAAGTGKSRLADAAAEMARRSGVPVSRSYCVDDPGAPPLWPWRRLVRGWPGADSLPGAEFGEPDAVARFRLFVAVTDLVSARAQQEGLLVVLEDVHWADRTSVLLLRHLVAELAELPVVVVATYRHSTPGALADVLPDLLRGESARPISLGGLGVDDVAAWLPELVGTADARFARVLHERTNGNPLLVRLVAEDVGRSGAVTDTEMLSRLMAERPQLRQIVAARVAPLEREARAVVDAASVLGERIDAGLLARMTGHPPGSVQRLLAAAFAVGVLRTVNERVSFEHALVRDAVYSELSPVRRAELHRRAACALEAALGVEVAGSIAGHWQRADGADALHQCLRWAETADEQARAACANDDAARFAQVAVDCARRAHAEPGELARLLVRLAEACILANHVDASLAASVAAADLAEAAGRVDLLAAAGLVVHGMGHPDVHRTIPPICERALALLPLDEHAIRSRLLAQIAIGVAEFEGGARPAELAAQALAEAELSGDAAAILEALAARHLAISSPNTVVERLQLGRRAVELATSARQPIAALWGHLWRVDAAFQLGNMNEVDRELNEIDRVARERGSPLARWHHHRYQATREALTGDFGAAREANDAAEALGQRVGDISLIGLSYAFRGQLAVVRGDPSELPPGWEGVIAAAPPIPLVKVSMPTQHALAGQLDLARAEFEQFRHLPADYPVGIRWAATVGLIAIAAVLVGDAEVADVCYTRLAATATYYSGDGSGGVFSHGSNARTVGDLARVAGRLDEALGHYRNAVAMNARIGARPFTALSRLGWAQTLVAAGQDLARAADLTAQAAAEFRRLDMPGPLAVALALTARLESERHTASPLSAREQEVADLVAQALSNREIANRLVLSERTVETHVRSILAKLAFTTRTEIATWVVRSRG